MDAFMKQEVPGPDNPRPDEPEGGRPPEPGNDEPIPEPVPPPRDPTAREEHGLDIGPGPDGDVRLI